MPSQHHHKLAALDLRLTNATDACERALERCQARDGDPVARRVHGKAERAQARATASLALATAIAKWLDEHPPATCDGAELDTYVRLLRHLEAL